jgi:hypothetical protein
MAIRMSHALGALVWMGLAWLAGCAAGPERDPYELDEADKQSYRIDCALFCQAEAACLSVPEDSSCRAWCEPMRAKGAVQTAYLDTRFDCVTGLGAACDQGMLDACWTEALAACSPAAGLDGFLRAWCTRWLECQSVPIPTYLQRCLDDLTASPDSSWWACFSQAALERFGQCVAEASCEQVVDQPVRNLCLGVYL